MAKYVKHDDARWRVTGEHQLDGLPAYFLSRRTPLRASLHEAGRSRVIGWKTVELVAYQRDCAPIEQGRKRRFRDDDGVIEFDSRGNITVRQKGGRKRYVTSIRGIIQMCAWREAQNKKRDRDFKRRTRKR